GYFQALARQLTSSAGSDVSSEPKLKGPSRLSQGDAPSICWPRATGVTMSMLFLFADSGVSATLPELPLWQQILLGLAVLAALLLLAAWLTVRYIPNQQAGVVEKLWSKQGSVPEGRIIALDGEAGFQADLLRGGLHLGLWRWQYRVHKM